MRTRHATAALFAAAATLALAPAASALTEGSLPGGTSISVDNTSPTDGAEYLVPIGDTTLDITDVGTAAVGAAEVVKDTSLVFVIDTSGSTGNPSGVDCDGGGLDTILRCEQVGALTANSAAAAATSPIADAAVTRFAFSGSIVTPLTADFSATAAGISGLTDGGRTNYQAGLQQAQNVLAGSSQPKSIVIFLSDGFANEGSVASTPSFGGNTIVKAFAIGDPSNVTCSSTSPNGDLDAVAALGNSQSDCQQVADPSQLAAAIGSAIGASLDALALSVDGSPYTAIPAGDVDVPLPTATTFDPKVANWSTTVSGLGLGSHEICAQATGTDVGGTDSVVDCKTITLLQLQNDGTIVDATNELGEDDQHTISVVVAGDDGGRDVTFDVAASGPNGPTSATVQTDADGKASFTWTSPQDPSGLGTDTVEVSITVGGQTQTLTFTKTWEDTTPPAAECLESVNPDGKNKPQAPGNGGQGQNQDGFYELSATDDIWPADALQVFVRDSGSGTVFGPFAVGDVIKYTESPDEGPVRKSIGGPNSGVEAHLIGTGDAEVYAVDGSGNVADPVGCLVPPPPQ